MWLWLVLTGGLAGAALRHWRQSSLPDLPPRPHCLPDGTQGLSVTCRYAGPPGLPFVTVADCEESLRDGLERTGCFASVEGGAEADYRAELHLRPGRGMNALTILVRFLGRRPENQFQLKFICSEGTKPKDATSFLNSVRDAGLMMADFPAGRMLLERHSPRLAQARQELSARTDPAALIKFISDTSPHWQPAEMALEKLRFRRGFAESPEMQLDFARGLVELVSCLDLLRILQLPSSPRFCRRCLGYLDQLPRLSTWPSQPELISLYFCGLSKLPATADQLPDILARLDRLAPSPENFQARWQLWVSAIGLAESFEAGEQLAKEFASTIDDWPKIASRLGQGAVWSARIYLALNKQIDDQRLLELGHELLARAEAGDIPMSAHILHDAYLCAERALTREPALQAADALVGRCRELGFTESSDSKDNGHNPCA